MITALSLIAAFVLWLVVVVARGLLADEIKGRIQQRTRAHLDATLDALPEEVRACWEDEWRAELAAKLDMPVTAWQLVCGIRRTAAALVGEAAPAAASERDSAPERRAHHVTPTLRAAILRNMRVRLVGVIVSGVGVVAGVGGLVVGVVVVGIVGVVVVVGIGVVSVVFEALDRVRTPVGVVSVGSGVVAGVGVVFVFGGVVGIGGVGVGIGVAAVFVAVVFEALDRVRTSEPMPDDGPAARRFANDRF